MVDLWLPQNFLVEGPPLQLKWGLDHNDSIETRTLNLGFIDITNNAFIAKDMSFEVTSDSFK